MTGDPPTTGPDGMAAPKVEGKEAVLPVGSAERTELIVGIGASAGGLDAFKTFFSLMPAKIGMAFVIVQHLDPKYDSSLAAIIAGYTTMPVHLSEEGALVAPDHVFVIPPMRS